MGEPVGDPYIKGENCIECWGPGKPFGDVLPPLYLRVTFVDIPAPNDDANLNYIATQVFGIPCQWTIITDDFLGQLWYDVGVTRLWLQRVFPPDVIFFALADPCSIIILDPPAFAEVS